MSLALQATEKGGGGYRFSEFFFYPQNPESQQLPMGVVEQSSVQFYSSGLT